MMNIFLIIAVEFVPLVFVIKLKSASKFVLVWFNDLWSDS